MGVVIRKCRRQALLSDIKHVKYFVSSAGVPVV